MALLNTRSRTHAENTTFHVYNRGLEQRKIFVDDADRREFIQCFRRYLSPCEFVDKRGRPYRKLAGSLDVLAYCLMPNHFHFVIHQRDKLAMATLLHSALTGYVKYFNNRHGRDGALFSGEYRAVPKVDAFEIQTAIAYVHLNHPDGPGYEFCSHTAYVTDIHRPDWLDIDAGLGVFGTRARYIGFLDGRLDGRGAKP